ncbi:MAG: DNRLRE domain-containing protein [Segetibacter sp.]
MTDLKGAKDTSFTDILPRTSAITLNTSPQGLQITLDGQPFTAPVTITSVEGVLRTIGAVTPQQGNYTFSNWSQGGNATQTFATPVNDVTYTANYNPTTSVTLTSMWLMLMYVQVLIQINNYGSSSILNSKKASLPDFTREVFIRFDISSFTAGVSSARLRLYGSLNSTENASVPVAIYDVTNISWLESSITWNNKPAAQTTVLATNTITGTAKQYYEWDLTQHINSLKTAGINFVTLKLLNTNITSSGVEFNSKEATVNKPQLVVMQSSARFAENNKISRPDKLSKEINFSVYPNPAQGNFNVVIDKYTGAGVVRLHDLNGRLVREYFITGNNTQQVHINNLKSGVYMVSVENGKSIKSKKIIIEK